jgi:hypothetical protein
MSSLIPLTQNHATSLSNVFEYIFPNGTSNFKNQEVALASLILPYSWYNITSAKGNNTFTLTFPITDGTTVKTVNIVIPDGFYTISKLNDYFQSAMIANDVYLVNGDGDNVYYFEIVANTTTGLAQINSYIVPTDAQFSAYSPAWSNPGSWDLPSTGSRVPQFVLTNQLFGNNIGFTIGTYPANTTQSSTYSVTSDFEPQISDVSSVLLTCSLVNNNLSSPNNIIATIPINNTYLGQITYSPNEFIWMRCLDGNVNSMSIRFLDQNGNNIAMRDNNINASLLIRDSK